MRFPCHCPFASFLPSYAQHPFHITHHCHPSSPSGTQSRSTFRATIQCTPLVPPTATLMHHSLLSPPMRITPSTSPPLGPPPPLRYAISTNARDPRSVLLLPCGSPATALLHHSFPPMRTTPSTSPPIAPLPPPSGTQSRQMLETTIWCITLVYLLPHKPMHHSPFLPLPP
jgi:hypothetical protein